VLTYTNDSSILLCNVIALNATLSEVITDSYRPAHRETNIAAHL